MSVQADAVRILVVDDDREMLGFLTDQLQSRGFQTEAVASGGEAIERVKHGHFDLMICDLKMPLIDGIACLETVTNLAPGLHVIMMSGEATVDSAVSAMKKGACDFLQKPLRMEQLLFRIDKVLLKNRMDSITKLYEKSLLLLSHLTPEEMLRPMLKTVSDFFRVEESCWVAVREGLLEIVVSKGFGPQSSYAMLDAAERALRQGEARPQLDSGLAAIPLWLENRPAALLVMRRAMDAPEFTLSELREASDFASQMLKTLEASRTRQELEDKVEQLKRVYGELEESKNLLVQREKLSHLGSLVAAIAHEMNGPLTVMIGYSDLLLSSPKDGEETLKPIAIIRQEAARCQGLVQQLLNFARERRPQFRWVHLEDIVTETLDALALEFEEQKVDVRLAMSPRMPGVNADPDQIKQVLLNLLRNAVQAMGAQKEKKIVVDAGASGKESVRLNVRDNGPGIAPENLAKVFDPYFTTKGEHGTGIGLSVCSDIVRAHHGKLSVQSLPGQGAVFTLELPQTQPEATTPLPHAA